jgi:shikimate kinase
MGAGKTTVGMRLARRLQLPFVDSDHEIERASNRSIAELFALYGESEFRDGERRVIARLIDDVPKVIATGGGAFMNEQTRGIILERGHAVWLDAPIDELASRTARRPGHRPLLQGGDAREILSQLAAMRNPTYSLAHIHIRNQSVHHGAAVEAILSALVGLQR